VLIGFVMFHQHPPSKALYYLMASELRLQLGDLKFIGCDGDQVTTC